MPESSKSQGLLVGHWIELRGPTLRRYHSNNCVLRDQDTTIKVRTNEVQSSTTGELGSLSISWLPLSRNVFLILSAKLNITAANRV